MILLVPISPEVPKRLRPRLWPGLLIAGLLLFGYQQSKHILKQDAQFIVNLDLPAELPSAGEALQALNRDLKMRPLLNVAPSRGDWTLERILMANFIHGNTSHLVINILCLFAGVRICSTFLPLATLLSIFALGGSVGLFLSMFLTYGHLQFIPHVGASAGIFALMGAYYIYNFRFRTRYFFWFPTRERYFLSLPTASFFFVDVILLEIVLSASQILPGRWDNVDHFAHVFGFVSGMIIALIFRLVQKWPPWLHTRAEYFLYRYLRRRNRELSFSDYISILDLNGFNDPLKCELISMVESRLIASSREELALLFKFISPTFMRYQTSETTRLISIAANSGMPFPPKWLHRLPYDLLIQIAHMMSDNIPNRHSLLYLFYAFINANLSKPHVVSRVQTLTDHLERELRDPRVGRASYDV